MSIRAEMESLRPRAGLRSRVRRVQERGVRILTAALGAALAWWLARDLLGHPQPFFAPVTVVVTLGLSYGQRLRRVSELVVGVAVGVLVGDLFVYLFGSGVWQLAVVATLAMTIATFLGAGLLLTIQAGVQSIIITTLVAAPDQAFSRWLDAVLGGAVALALAMIAPAAPVTKPRRDVVDLTEEVGAILRESAAAVRAGDVEAAEDVLRRARGTEAMIAALRDGAGAANEIAAISPLHARHRGEVRLVASAINPLDRCVRNLRVLARRTGVAVRVGESVPDRYLLLVDRLAATVDELARELDQGRLGIEVRERLVRVGRAAGRGEPGATLSAELIRAQLRSMVVDLLMVTGLDYPDAVALVRAE